MSIIPHVLRSVIQRRPDLLQRLSPHAQEVIKAKTSDYQQKRRKARAREEEAKAKITAIFERAKAQVVASHAYNQDELRQALAAILRSYYTEVAREEASRAAAEFAIGFDPTAVDRLVQTWAEKYTYDLIGGIQEQTLATVQSAIAAFTSTPGMTNADLEGMLAPAFGEVRAEMIAVTEVTRAYAEGERVFQDLMSGEGIDTVREWLTSEDERVCPICGELDGQTAGPDEDFDDGLEGPPAHPNCRCAVQVRLAD